MPPLVTMSTAFEHGPRFLLVLVYTAIVHEASIGLAGPCLEDSEKHLKLGTIVAALICLIVGLASENLDQQFPQAGFACTVFLLQWVARLTFIVREVRSTKRALTILTALQGRSVWVGALRSLTQLKPQDSETRRG